MISVEAVPGASAARAEYMERLMSRLDQTVVPTDGPTHGAITGSFPLPLTALTQRQGIHSAALLPFRSGGQHEAWRFLDQK